MKKRKYINLLTKEIVCWTDKQRKDNDLEEYVLLSHVQDKIVLISINNYKIFDSIDDTFGFNKDIVKKFITNGYKAWDEKSANAISRNYHICPYCANEAAKIDTSKTITVDVGNDFNKIGTMKFNILQMHKCVCGNEFEISTNVTAPTIDRADILKECLKNDVDVYVRCDDILKQYLYINIVDLMIYLKKEFGSDWDMTTALDRKFININKLSNGHIDNLKVYAYIREHERKIKNGRYNTYE